MPINFASASRPMPTPATGIIGGVEVPYLVKGTPEQEAIWDALLHGTTHMVVDAVAGSGKSFSLVQGILRLRNLSPLPRICVLAFNKHIAEEMVNKFRAANIDYATARTYNSFGWSACRKAFHPDLDDLKTGRIIEEIVDDRYGLDNLEWGARTIIFAATRRLVSLCKAYLLDGTDQAQLDTLADKHNVSLNGSTEIVMDLVPRVLAACGEETSVMDYDDQVWQTVTKHLPIDQYDVLMVDEAQDTSLMQQEMAMMACPKGRIVIVGDVRQAIFGFRGADAEAMPRMQARLGATDRGVQSFPLTVTRRCPKSHVALAQAIVPQIRALDDAPEGEIECLAQSQAVRAMRPGDLVLCRTNAPLVPIAYMLITAGIKAVIRGRDIGTNLRQLIDKLRAGDKIHTLLEKLAVYREKELGKLRRLGERGLPKVQSLTDRCDCIEALTVGVNSVTALKAKIDRVFADFEDDGAPKDAVVFGTVHRTKGLEANVVYVLAPELLPHPMARQEWEQTQERNCCYVAVTRAKFDNAKGLPGRLVFVQGPKSLGIPKIFSKGEDHNEPSE